jgi:hypothetical protein
MSGNVPQTCKNGTTENPEEGGIVGRPRTATEDLDLSKLLQRPMTRFELDATPYACELAEDKGLIARAGKKVNATLWKLTPKGRRKARK